MLLDAAVVAACSKCGTPLEALAGSFTLDAAWGRADCPRCRIQQRLRPVLIPDELAAIRMRLRRLSLCAPNLITRCEIEAVDAILTKAAGRLHG